jgi:hypothetical protein
MLLSGFFFHPYYVSVVEAEYEAKEKLVGISCKIFSDDLETTLKTFSGRDVDILKGDKKNNDELLKKYFAAHLWMEIDGKRYEPSFLGYENDKEATWVYLEVKDIGEMNQVDVITDMLYDFKKAQQNIIHFIANGKRQSFRLQYPEKKAGFRIAH